MRWIEKRKEPRSLQTWRAQNATDINFGYALMRQDRQVVTDLEAALLAEQGYLCAYTGRRIGKDSYHMEHVKPNRSVPCLYGAEAKKNFPKPDEEHLFVSPLNPSCEQRFNFTAQGIIKPTSDSDEAAKRTIEKLNLNEPRELVPLREAAIDGALKPEGLWLSLDKARKTLVGMERRTKEGGMLPPFSFAICRALQNHIAELERRQAATATD
jgi:hypothetical protein